MPLPNHRTGLSKSKFLAGLQCLKRLYLLSRQPEQAPSADPQTQALFDAKHLVGELARKLFPGGQLVAESHTELPQAIRQTQCLLAARDVPAIFEATLALDDILIRADILERVSTNRWRLIEVKSSTEAEEQHVPDVAIQKHVLAGCGVRLERQFVMCLNRDYVYDGVRLNLPRLFKTTDISRDVQSFEKTLLEAVQLQKRTLTRRTPPDIAPGPHCDAPYPCEFRDLCCPALPPGHVSTLYRSSPKLQERLENAGFKLLRQIPTDFGLSAIQSRMVQCAKTRKACWGPGLRKELAGLRYPLCFMDFETETPAIPRFKGMRPYDMLPFQWSVHVVEQPGKPAQHFHYLAQDQSDPRPAFVKELLRALDAQGRRGHIVVYNKAFESGRLSDLASWFPVYAKRITAVKDRLWDLLPAVRDHVYHPRFEGSFSIKSVLPALIPDMSYQGMEVSEGGQAGLAWEQMISAQTPESDRLRLRQALLDYCQQDTLAMVRILERLRQQAG